MVTQSILTERILGSAHHHDDVGKQARAALALHLTLWLDSHATSPPPIRHSVGYMSI
jgi:hypothetical protein